MKTPKWLRPFGRPAVYGALLVALGTAAQDRFSGEALVMLASTLIAAIGPSTSKRNTTR